MERRRTEKPGKSGSEDPQGSQNLRAGREFWSSGPENRAQDVFSGDWPQKASPRSRLVPVGFLADSRAPLPFSMARPRLFLVAALLAAAQLLLSNQAQSDPAHRANDGPIAGSLPAPLEPPLVLFDLGVGFLALPAAPICSPSYCVRGDSTPVLELWGLARPFHRWAFGAGATFGWWSTTTLEGRTEDEGSASRSYLFFEATGRYYLLTHNRFQWWIGPEMGVALLGDRFMSQKLIHNRYARIGDPGTQLATAGPIFGGGTSLNYAFSRYLRLGLGLRGGALIFPQDPKTTDLGQQASVSGINLYVAGGINLQLSTGM